MQIELNIFCSATSVHFYHVSVHVLHRPNTNAKRNLIFLLFKKTPKNKNNALDKKKCCVGKQSSGMFYAVFVRIHIKRLHIFYGLALHTKNRMEASSKNEKIKIRERRHRICNSNAFALVLE